MAWAAALAPLCSHRAPLEPLSRSKKTTFQDRGGPASVKPLRAEVTSASSDARYPALSFPGGSEIKASACNAGDLGLTPGSGRSPGEGNGYPLQYSCLENPMDRGVWWATIHRVTKSWTRPSNFTFTFTFFPPHGILNKACILEDHTPNEMDFYPGKELKTALMNELYIYYHNNSKYQHCSETWRK